MSAPPLGEASPNSVGASFYNSTDPAYFPHKTTPETAEDIAPPLNSDTTPGLLDIHFEMGADVDTPDPSYISEDSRFSLLCANLRAIETLFRDIAAKSFGSSTSIPQETLRLLPSILRTLIQFIRELQANNSQLHISNARFQASQENGQTREQEMEGKMTIYRPFVSGLTKPKAHIGVLQGEIELVKDAKMGLEFKINELRREMREVEQSYKNIQAQRDSLKAELEQLGFRAILDFSTEGSSKKRNRQAIISS
ncbi:hypothetical protein BKA64DRAFT_648384 [Cadophora sp. MPI-SDFR-AT-0126]|nr:hypothetical protein BKA64DRAFT_648384 [Leotiomycetes sp. MPI-SDFR-AT-0126]